MAIAVPEVFPEAIHLYCCQHIADNMQQRFGNKIRPLFWRAARALIKACFKEEMAVL
jgi:transposase-like protein